jgi:hypothetical protein
VARGEFGLEPGSGTRDWRGKSVVTFSSSRTMLTRRVVRVSRMVVARARAVEAHLSSGAGPSGASLALYTKSWPFSCSKTASSILNLPWCESHRPDTSMGFSGHRRGSRLDCMRRYPTRCSSPLRAPAHPTPSRDHVVEAHAPRRTRRATRRSAERRAFGAPGREKVKANIDASVCSLFRQQAERREDVRRECEARRRTCEATRRDTSSFARVRSCGVVKRARQ